MVTVTVFWYLTDIDRRNVLMESEDKLYKNIVRKVKGWCMMKTDV